MSTEVKMTFAPEHRSGGAELGNGPVASDLWLAVASIALGVFAFVTTEFIPVGVLPQIASELHVRLGTAGLMLTIPGLISAVTSPLLVVAAGKLDRRLMLLGLTTLLLGSNLLSGLAPNFATMLLGRALLGCCLGGFWTLALAAGNRLVRRGSVTRAISIIVSGMTCATVIGLPLGTFAGTLLSWRGSFLVTTMLAASALIAQLRCLPPLPSRSVVKADDFYRLLRRAPTLSGIGLASLLFGANIATYTYVAPFLENVAGFHRHLVTPVLLAFGVIGFLSNLVAAPLVASRPKATLTILTIAMALCMVAMPIVATSHIDIVVVLAVWAIPFGAVPLCLNDWTQRSAPQVPEAASALFISAVQFSIALGALAAAGMVTAIGVPANVWLGGVLAMIGLAVILLFSPVPSSASEVG